MSVDNKAFMKACGNKGVVKSEYSKNYTAHILHAAPGGFPSHVSTGLLPYHSFVMPIQGVEAGFANGTGHCPFVHYIQYFVLSLKSYE